MVIAAPPPSSTVPAAAKIHQPEDKRQRSVFEVPSEFFDSCRLLPSPSYSAIPIQYPDDDDVIIPDEVPEIHPADMQRWACSTCNTEFDSLQEQRSHYSSDFHRLNVKLSFAGKRTIAEEDFDETTLDSLCRDFDVSSISGSEDEDENETGSRNITNSRVVGSLKNKLFVQLSNGDKVSLWKSLLLDGSESIVFENDRFSDMDYGSLQEKVVIGKLKEMVDEPRNSTCLRVVLLAKGGHFAGCVFDGNTVIDHKTFHRYVVRAKAGKRQSAKDAGGRTIHSAGASLRRYNELALKKNIRDLLASWRIYFAASSCVFLHAPNNNQLFFDGKRPYFNSPHHVVRNIPLVVGRPTFKEAQRIYKLLTQVYSEKDVEIMPSTATINYKESSQPDSLVTNGQSESSLVDREEIVEEKASLDTSQIEDKMNSVHISTTESESGNICASTPLHEAAKSGNIQEVMDLLEQGLDPCVKDERGRTPYIVATEKEVRNAFRRFMASNLDKWDWHAANVPSPLTQELEEAQAAKQAEKDAKRKARAKELKKLRKAKEKKAQAEAEAAQSKIASSSQPKLSKEEELKRAQDAEREKRAEAAERRIAAMAALKAEEGSGRKVTATSVPVCSCCHVSLSGLVPFHRFNYKYCSTTCMHMHRGEKLQQLRYQYALAVMFLSLGWFPFTGSTTNTAALRACTCIKKSSRMDDS